MATSCDGRWYVVASTLSTPPNRGTRTHSPDPGRCPGSGMPPANRDESVMGCATPRPLVVGNTEMSLLLKAFPPGRPLRRARARNPAAPVCARRPRLRARTGRRAAPARRIGGGQAPRAPQAACPRDQQGGGAAASALPGEAVQLLQLPQPEQGRADGDPQAGAAHASRAPGADAGRASAPRCGRTGTSASRPGPSTTGTSRRRWSRPASAA